MSGSLSDGLRRIDGRSYPAYKDLRGRWELDGCTLWLEHVQGDPFASPSHLRVRVDAGIPAAYCADPVQRMAAEDWLLRRFADGLVSRKRGSGRSGLLSVYRPGPEICRRSAVRVGADGLVDVRFRGGLPARGRRIDATAAHRMLLEDVPDSAVRLVVGDDADLAAHVRSVQLQQALRNQLDAHGLIAFIADGSVLPRASGVSQEPLRDAVPFASPDNLRVTLDTPFGPVAGLGIRQGVTVITGGGFHGKSTVLGALQRGHLDHVPGDGRERVVAHADTVKIRAEDGRSVQRVDIRPFLGDLPGGRSTRAFSTPDASGSTSQAASLVEALEAGARVLLLDEDTSATNLLVRDARMQQLIPADREPITPFVQRVRQLAQRGVSTVLVIGGVSDYLAVADTVIAMHDWLPSDVTARAHQLCPDRPDPPVPWPDPSPRIPDGRGLDADRVRARDTRAVTFGRTEIDLTAVEQVLDASHASTLGHALRFLGPLADGRRSLPQLLDALEAILDDEGIEALAPRDPPTGDLIHPRRHEVAATCNRLRHDGVFRGASRSDDR